VKSLAFRAVARAFTLARRHFLVIAALSAELSFDEFHRRNKLSS
jgi:hypothetical protein